MFLLTHLLFHSSYYAAPSIDVLTAVENGVKLSWTCAEETLNYRIYRRTVNTGWSRIAQLPGSSYIDTTAKKGVKYFYTLRLVSASGDRFLSYYQNGRSIVYCETPAVVSIGNSENGIALQWNAVEGASSYRVFYFSGSSWKYLDAAAGTSYTDTRVQDGERRVYMLRCIDDSGNYGSYYDPDGWECTYYAPPVITSVSFRSGAYTVKWEEKPCGGSYIVYRKALGGKSWTRLSVVEGDQYIDEKAPANAYVTYTLRLADESGRAIS